MRQGIGCVLHEADPGSLVELRRRLESWRFVCRSVATSPEAEAVAADGEILIVELGGERSPAVAAAVAAQRAAGRASLALCDHDDAKAHSLATSLGFDDMLTLPLDPVELVRRLQMLATFTELTAEHRRRTQMFAPYQDQASTAAAPAMEAPHRPRVAMLGKPDDNQVRAAAALPPAMVTYLESATQLPALLRGGAIELLIVTHPGLIAGALEAIEASDGEPPMFLAAHCGPPTALELPPQVDLLPLPAPMSLARARLALALRIGGLRRWLREPQLGQSRPLLVDALTGLYNQGAFLDYLLTAHEGRALIGIEPDRLDQLNRTAGYAAGNRALAHLGHMLRRATRAEDLAAHLGGGRFAVAVTAANRQQLERLRCRLEATLADGQPWHVLAAAEALPIRGAPANRLARLFGDLRRLQPAA